MRSRQRLRESNLNKMLLSLIELSEIWAGNSPPSAAKSDPWTEEVNAALTPERAPVMVPPEIGNAQSFVTKVLPGSALTVLAEMALDVSSKVAADRLPALRAFVIAAEFALTDPEETWPAKEALGPETTPSAATLPFDSIENKRVGVAATR
jgi:hypothetical protein